MEERFWKKVKKTRGCWLWTACKHPTGYGLVAKGPNRCARAHRVAYEMLVGPIPKGMHLLHSCDNPACVNPKHLRPGTDADNRKDCCLKGRAGRSHLKIEDVKNIKKLRKEGYTLKELAEQFNVSLQNIHSIVTNKTWNYV